MKRKKPSFDESYYGYRSFTHLLEEADNSPRGHRAQPQERHVYGHPLRGERRDRKAHPPKRANNDKPALPVPVVPDRTGRSVGPKPARGIPRRRRR